MADDAGIQDGTGWLERLRMGDAPAFAEFVGKYEELVFLCCRSLGLGEADSEDVASETFLAAYRGLGKYHGRAKLSTWLWRIAYNKAVSFLRKNKRWRQLRCEVAADLTDERNFEPLEVLEDKEREEIVRQAVNELPRLWGVAVILFYREDKKIFEIAKIMRIQQNTVKTYLFRARKRLRKILLPVLCEGIDSGEKDE